MKKRVFSSTASYTCYDCPLPTTLAESCHEVFDLPVELPVRQRSPSFSDEPYFIIRQRRSQSPLSRSAPLAVIKMSSQMVRFQATVGMALRAGW